jgi:hypothetical protein
VVDCRFLQKFYFFVETILEKKEPHFENVIKWKSFTTISKLFSFFSLSLKGLEKVIHERN